MDRIRSLWRASGILACDVVAVECVDVCGTAHDIFHALFEAEMSVPSLIEASAAFKGAVGVVQNSDGKR